MAGQSTVEAAVTELMEFVSANTRCGLRRDGDEFKRLQALDASVFAACNTAGLQVSPPKILHNGAGVQVSPPSPRENLRPFGQTHIPSFVSAAGFCVVATEGWLHSMRRLLVASISKRFRADQIVVVTTAGDLWKALAEGKEPHATCSKISIRSGPNIPEVSYPHPTDQAKQNDLRKALVILDDAGGDRAEAMHKLIKRVAVAMNVDPTHVVNMQLAQFVAAADAIADGASKQPPAQTEGDKVVKRSGDGQPEPATGVRPPSKDAIACYRANVITGLKQTQLAERMTTELKRPIAQGQVSRWIGQVEKWITAGNVLPDFPKAERRNPAALDPQALELGKRQDHRTPRQRDRRSEDSDD